MAFRSVFRHLSEWTGQLDVSAAVAEFHSHGIEFTARFYERQWRFRGRTDADVRDGGRQYRGQYDVFHCCRDGQLYSNRDELHGLAAGSECERHDNRCQWYRSVPELLVHQMQVLVDQGAMDLFLLWRPVQY